MARKTREEAFKTRQSLLAAALIVFSRQGYSAATLEDVARQAGVTRGAIYWHFGSKADLYLDLLKEYSGRSERIVQQAASEGGSFRDILQRIFVRLLHAVEDDAELREMMEINFFKTERSPELQDGLQQRQEASRQLVASLAGVMQQAVQSGELRSDLPPEEMARAFLALQNGLIYLWLQDRASFSLRESAAAQAEILFHGLDLLQSRE